MWRACRSSVHKLEESTQESKQSQARHAFSGQSPTMLPVTVVVPARNEARNLPRCLESLHNMGEVYVIDSESTDATAQIARSHGAQVVQFHYQGGWPKKRQWAMESLPLAYDWILLVDADESLTPQLEQEIRRAIEDAAFDGYYIALRVHFLGRELRHCGASFYKLSLFRRGKGRYECRLREQDTSMADMEIHEHVMVDGKTTRLKHPLLHHNIESLSRYIRKHDEYSNWEARVWLQDHGSGAAGDQLPPSLFGSQAQRRRWLKRNFLSIPGSSLLFFLYKYVGLLGFLDGVPGLIFCVFQGIQFFHVKAKIYELRTCATESKKD
jgi:glycosyltransferase involved in cell wall biosynthesis